MTRRFGIVALSILITATIVGGIFGNPKRRSLQAKGSDKTTIISRDVEEDFQEAVDVVSGQ